MKTNLINRARQRKEELEMLGKITFRYILVIALVIIIYFIILAPTFFLIQYLWK